MNFLQSTIQTLLTTDAFGTIRYDPVFTQSHLPDPTLPPNMNLVCEPLQKLLAKQFYHHRMSASHMHTHYLLLFPGTPVPGPLQNKLPPEASGLAFGKSRWRKWCKGT
jgi:hypothetical protein